MGKVVPGDGPRPCDLMIVGEAPGAQEEKEGRPFVGASGSLLNVALEAVGARREDAYITNVVKERPPNNRTPSREEISASREELGREIDDVHPRRILALGRVPRDCLLPWLSDERLGLSREAAYHYQGTDITVYVTWHPAYILYNGKNTEIMMQFVDDIRHWYVGA